MTAAERLQNAAETDCTKVAAHRTDLREVLDLLAAAQRDAARYRWLRDEAWGGGMTRHKFPHVVEYRPGLMPTAVCELAEEALDDAIDAAISAAATPAGAAD